MPRGWRRAFASGGCESRGLAPAAIDTLDTLAAVKRAAAERWVRAVNAGGTQGRWAHAVAKRPSEIDGILESF